jgi:hypothetical protein
MPLRAMTKLVAMYQSTRSNCRARSELGNQEIRSMPRGAEAIREEGFHKIRQLVLQRLQEKDV